MTDTISKSLSLNSTQQANMELWDNNSSLYSEGKIKSVSNRKSIISNFSANSLLGYLVNQTINRISLCFISEIVSSSLPRVVDADNPDPSLLKKVTKPTCKPSMLQWMPSTFNQSENLSIHEIYVEKGMDKFSKILNQFGEEHYWTKGKYCMLRTVDKESSELQKCKSKLMRSLVIFPAAQELQEWSCLASGVISTEAVRSSVNLPEK